MGKLLLLFIAVPAVELALLVEVGKRIGTPATLGLIVVTGALGAGLARWQGIGVLAEIRRQLAAGKMPAGALGDGVLLLLAGAVLITPGLLTDAFGFALLVPPVRRWIKAALWRRLESSLAAGRVVIDGPGARRPGPSPGYGPGPSRDPDVIDAEWRVTDD